MLPSLLNFSFPPHLIFNADTDLLHSRRAPSQKAWTSAINPITQKNTSQSLPNGNISHQKPAVPERASTSKEAPSSDKHAHDRLTFILAASIVSPALLTRPSIANLFQGTTNLHLYDIRGEF